jgi:hypothetical protein
MPVSVVTGIQQARGRSLEGCSGIAIPNIDWPRAERALASAFEKEMLVFEREKGLEGDEDGPIKQLLIASFHKKMASLAMRANKAMWDITLRGKMPEGWTPPIH